MIKMAGSEMMFFLNEMGGGLVIFPSRSNERVKKTDEISEGMNGKGVA